MFKRNDLLNYLKLNNFLEGTTEQVVGFLLSKLLEYYRLDWALVGTVDQERIILHYSMNIPAELNELESTTAANNPVGLILQGNEPLIINDLKAFSPQNTETPSAFTQGTMLGYPLLDQQGNHLGVVALFGRQVSRVTTRSMDLLANYSCRISLEVDNAHLHAKLGKLKDALEKYTVTDRGTGVYKRSFLSEKLEHEFRRAQRYGRPLSCVMFAVDNYNEFIQRFGINFTNCILKEFSKLLKSWLREIDFVFRYSTSEFFLILPETSMEHSFLLAERLKYKIESHRLPVKEIAEQNESMVFSEKIKLSEEEIEVKVKMGLSSYPSNNVTTSAELINLTDTLLSQHRGTNDTYVN
ncbi:MAG: hypothetical protein A2284_03955 [Deltaproteobacteria bacterium RIFOXYA12_FULL_61_11]|nr:MAG: hypothetical protein A2284_03955 [Deltaproteobacteria bacterium RIFOXYA12_FULL_61_11]